MSVKDDIDMRRSCQDRLFAMLQDGAWHTADEMIARVGPSAVRCLWSIQRDGERGDARFSGWAYEKRRWTQHKFEYRLVVPGWTVTTTVRTSHDGKATEARAVQRSLFDVSEKET